MNRFPVFCGFCGAASCGVVAGSGSLPAAAGVPSALRRFQGIRLCDKCLGRFHVPPQHWDRCGHRRLQFSARHPNSVMLRITRPPDRRSRDLRARAYASGRFLRHCRHFRRGDNDCGSFRFNSRRNGRRNRRRIVRDDRRRSRLALRRPHACRGRRKVPNRIKACHQRGRHQRHQHGRARHGKPSPSRRYLRFGSVYRFRRTRRLHYGIRAFCHTLQCQPEFVRRLESQRPDLSPTPSARSHQLPAGLSDFATLGGTGSASTWARITAKAPSTSNNFPPVSISCSTAPIA